MQKQPHLARLSPQIDHVNITTKYIDLAINEIIALQYQPQPLMLEHRVRHQRPLRQSPRAIINPRKLAIHPHAETMHGLMVLYFAANVRERQ